nr:MAG TPA: hypothetical protein [Caudoviricetes sp.]
MFYLWLYNNTIILQCQYFILKIYGKTKGDAIYVSLKVLFYSANLAYLQQ